MFQSCVSVYFGRLTVVRSELIHKKNLYFYDSPFFLDITLFVCGRISSIFIFPYDSSPMDQLSSFP